MKTSDLHEAIRAAFGSETTPEELRDLGRRMKDGFAGRLRPWSWFGEITRGCNLRCGNWKTMIPVVGTPQSSETLTASALHESSDLGTDGAAEWNRLQADAERA